MTRRMFLSLMLLSITACSVKKLPEVKSDEAFTAWLKKKRRYKDFETMEEAKKAYLEETEKERKRKEWREWKQKAGLGVQAAE